MSSQAVEEQPSRGSVRFSFFGLGNKNESSEEPKNDTPVPLRRNDNGNIPEDDSGLQNPKSVKENRSESGFNFFASFSRFASTRQIAISHERDDPEDRAALEALKDRRKDDRDLIRKVDDKTYNAEALKVLNKDKDEVQTNDKVDGVPITEIHRLSPEELASLGPGPARFFRENERTINDQIATLNDEERKCFDALKEKWMKRYPEKPFSDDMFLRFARCSPGRQQFNEQAAWHVMQDFNRRYLTLTASRLESQLWTKTLFPIPGLKSKDGHDLFYMRPSNYFPSKTPTKDIVDNLVYAMTAMGDNENATTNGIGLVAYMNDWNMQNFSLDYALQFSKTLQGRIPCRVNILIVVNPPSWFGSVWAIIKPMLSVDFIKKHKFVKESELGNHLLPDNYQDYLPDDMESGKAPTEKLIQDFIAYRKAVEMSV